MTPRRSRVVRGAVLVTLVALGGSVAAMLWHRFSEPTDSPWGVVWAEALSDDEAVLVWQGEGSARIGRVSLRDGHAERTLEEQGTVTVLAKTPGVLWLRYEGGIMAVDLPALVRHRVEGTLRSDPRLSNYQRVVGATIDRLVLTNERGERFAVGADGSIESVQTDAPLDPAFDAGGVRTPIMEQGPYEDLALGDIPLPSPAFLCEGGRPVTIGDVALVVGRDGTGPSETHVVGAVAADGTVRWRAPAIAPAGRVIWVSRQGDRYIALARRLLAPEGEGAARWVYRSELVRVDAARGPVERVVLVPGRP